MTIRVLGAFLIIAGCAGVGCALARNYRREEQAMGELVQCLEWMICEMNYRMPPLASLFRGAADVCKGAVSQTMRQLANELDQQLTPNVDACMYAAITAVPNLPERPAAHLRALGTSLGHFGLEGQINRLQAASVLCKQDLQRMSSGRETRLRNYQTLGICAGVALVIIFI